MVRPDIHPKHLLAVLSGSALAIGAVGVSNGQTCTGAWSEQFALAGTSAQISDTVIWDDGTGPALYAVGSFATRSIGRIDLILDGATASGAYHVAKWDGRNWNIVGQNPIIESDPPFAASRLNTIQVWDPDGPGGQPSGLVVGGLPNSNSPAPHATLFFDGTAWSRMGQNIARFAGEEVRDLEVFNGELYACGKFDPATGLSGIAKWDANLLQWVDVGGGIPTPTTFIRVERMAAGDADGDGTAELYVSGTFTFSATGGSAAKLVKWNGSNWATVPGFTGTSTPNAANLGGPSVLKFMDIGDGPALLVGDAVYSGLPSPANLRGVALARLKNGVWSTLLAQTASGPFKSYPFTAEMFTGPDGLQLHIGGQRLLNGVSGQPAGVSLARRNASGTWSPLGTFAANNSGGPAWMQVVDWDFAGPGGQKLLFGAVQFRFGTLGTISGFDLNAAGMALWNGTGVEIAHSGTGALGLSARVFKELDPDGPGPLPMALYIGHGSTVVEGIPTSGLVGFDGTSYQRLPAGMISVDDFIVFTPAGGTPALYAAGITTTSGISSLTRLDGATWTTVTQPGSEDPNEVLPPVIDAVTTATVAGEPSLVVSGRFREIGGVASRFVARYNGTAWIAMDAGLPPPPNDPNLIYRTNSRATRVVNVGGELFMTVQPAAYDQTIFTEVALPSRLYRWDGTAWQDVGEGEPRLHVLDLGTGPALYSLRNSQPTGDNSSVAQWNGTTFVQVGPGFNWPNGGTPFSRSNVQGLGVHDFGLGKRLVVSLDAPATTTSGQAVAGLLYLEGGQWLEVSGGNHRRQTPTIFSSSNPAWGGLYLAGAVKNINSDALQNGAIESQGIARYINGSCACGPSDIAGPNQSIGADGQLTADDIIVFLAWYFATDLRADVAGPNQSTTPDSAFSADDIIVFLSRYFAGC